MALGQPWRRSYICNTAALSLWNLRWPWGPGIVSQFYSVKQPILVISYLSIWGDYDSTEQTLGTVVLIYVFSIARHLFWVFLGTKMGLALLPWQLLVILEWIKAKWPKRIMRRRKILMEGIGVLLELNDNSINDIPEDSQIYAVSIATFFPPWRNRIRSGESWYFISPYTIAEIRSRFWFIPLFIRLEKMMLNDLPSNTQKAGIYFKIALWGQLTSIWFIRSDISTFPFFSLFFCTWHHHFYET